MHILLLIVSKIEVVFIGLMAQNPKKELLTDLRSAEFSTMDSGFITLC